MFIQNSWSFNSGVQNKPKLPAQKFGKDGRLVFNKNKGYDGPDRITSIMWVSTQCNVNDALKDLQMELEGESLQICWKQTQKKNTRIQIVLYGLLPGFNTK